MVNIALFSHSGGFGAINLVFRVDPAYIRYQEIVLKSTGDRAYITHRLFYKNMAMHHMFNAPTCVGKMSFTFFCFCLLNKHVELGRTIGVRELEIQTTNP